MVLPLTDLTFHLFSSSSTSMPIDCSASGNATGFDAISGGATFEMVVVFELPLNSGGTIGVGAGLTVLSAENPGGTIGVGIPRSTMSLDDPCGVPGWPASSELPSPLGPAPGVWPAVGTITSIAPAGAAAVGLTVPVSIRFGPSATVGVCQLL